MELSALEVLTKLSPFLAFVALIIIGSVWFCQKGLPVIHAAQKEKKQMEYEYNLKMQLNEHELKRRDDEIMMSLADAVKASTIILADIKRTSDNTSLALTELHVKNTEYDVYRAELKAVVSELNNSISSMEHSMCSPETHRMLQQLIDMTKELLIRVGGKNT